MNITDKIITALDNNEYIFVIGCPRDVFNRIGYDDICIKFNTVTKDVCFLGIVCEDEQFYYLGFCGLSAFWYNACLQNEKKTTFYEQEVIRKLMITMAQEIDEKSITQAVLSIPPSSSIRCSHINAAIGTTTSYYDVRNRWSRLFTGTISTFRNFVSDLRFEDCSYVNFSHDESVVDTLQDFLKKLSEKFV